MADKSNKRKRVEDEDPLDVYMTSMVLPEIEKLKNTASHSSFSSKIDDKYDEEEDDVDYDDDRVENNKKKVDKLPALVIDHSKVEYPSFRKNFYIQVKEISSMPPQEVGNLRKELELKLHGKDVPNPIKTWVQAGLSTKVLQVIKEKLGYEKPMSIQAQALPVIMSGRDCIGIAKTGSSKTLAFALPMLRHIQAQSAIVPGRDGPIALIIAPTRELVQQIHKDIMKFAKVMGIRSVPVYGGSQTNKQINAVKNGTEIVICTPGRMIDFLCKNNGRMINLSKVTYLVLDEADRMFDMGFEPQITHIVQSTRPDRRTVLFSATFPRRVEQLARQILTKPVEIQVGGRNVVNKDISQLVEVRPESERFLRLLELLGEWYEKGKILIFVQSQATCDTLLKNLFSHGYACLSLHGAKDQMDRESAISDFRNDVCKLLIATSVAARGLDVKELELVINFHVPNHYEDYIHRVGRTGRAGRKGCAITFIAEDEARYAPDLVKALELSAQAVPEDLRALADGFMAKVNQGLEQAHGTGYGGIGFKFNGEEDEAKKAEKKAQARGYGLGEEDCSDSDIESGDESTQEASIVPELLPDVSCDHKPGVPLVVHPPAFLPNGAAQLAALKAAARQNLEKILRNVMPKHYTAEFEINDYPQIVRWKVTHRETLGPISEWTGASITTKGQYYPPRMSPKPGDERKLYLSIEGLTESSVQKAMAELERVAEDFRKKEHLLPGASLQGKYSIVP
ncbi:hypothetical protein C5167_028530 [Papaver somniferum]|nr:hypothetical protein C5167_028530 [Papaver somniferum]